MIRTLLSIAVTTALITASPTANAQTPATHTDELIVTSSRVPQPRRQIGTAISVIDAADIELRGYEDLADLLRTQPGIGVSNSGGPGKTTLLRIRGEDNYRTQLIIDGVKALDPSAPQVSPSFDSLLTTSDLQRVEVLRGPQGFIYGADAGGVVNVLTKRGADELGGQLGLEYGEYSTRRVDAAFSGGSDTGDFYVSVADLETDGFNAQAADTELHDDDGAANTTLHAKLGWNLSESLRLQLVARDIDAENAYDGCGFPASYDCGGTLEQTTYKVSAEQTLGRVSNSFGYSSIDIVRDNFADGLLAFGTQGELSRFEYTGTLKASDSFALVYGADLQDEALVDDNGRASRDQRGYYVEYQGAYRDSLFVSLGTRYDDNDDFGSHTSSRLSIAYAQDFDSNRSLKYRASVGTGFRAPSLYENAYNSGPFAFPPSAGTLLQEENSEGYDIGVEYSTPGGVHFEVTYFDQTIDDAIEFDLANYSGYLQSLGTSTSTGVEIAANIPFGERWELIANWTNNDAEDTAGAQRLRRPKNLGNFGVAYRSASSRFDFIANYRLAKDSVDIGNVALDDYDVLDLSARYTVARNLEIFGRVQNVTDEDYQELAGYNTAKRSAYTGVRMRF
jgi:vitamin B12 transporter